MENRFHERDDVSVAGGLENHPIEMHLSKTWRRVQQVQAKIIPRVHLLSRIQAQLVVSNSLERKNVELLKTLWWLFDIYVAKILLRKTI